MQFVFDERKAAQAAAYLLRLHGGPMPYIKLIKLLYLVDRRTFVETGYPTTGDRFVAMPHGPVLSRVLDLITWGRREADSPWSTYVSQPMNYCVMAIGPPDEGRLSEYDRTTIDAILDEFGAMDPWELVDYTHTLPEWSDPGGSSVGIDPRVILRNAGCSDEAIAAIESEVAEIHWFHVNYVATG